MLAIFVQLAFLRTVAITGENTEAVKESPVQQIPRNHGIDN